MSVGIGDRAPDFTLPGTGGVSHSLSDHRGGVVVIGTNDGTIICFGA